MHTPLWPILMLPLAACAAKGGTMINGTDRSVFVRLGTEQLYLAPGQSIASALPHPTGPISVYSAGAGPVRCAGTMRGANWRLMITAAGPALTCILY